MHLSYIFGVTDDFQEVLVTDEVESSKALALLLQVVTESFLNLAEHIRESLQVLLQVLDGHDIEDDRFLSNLLHQLRELVVNAPELVELS